MEPGPARLLDIEGYGLQPEEPLSADQQLILVEGLVEFDQGLSATVTQIETGLNELDRETFVLHEQLNVVEAELGGAGGVPPEPQPEAIAAATAEMVGAISDAHEKVPEIVTEPPPGQPLPPPPEIDTIIPKQPVGL